MSGRRRAAATALASVAIAALAVLAPVNPAHADPGLAVDVDAPSVDGTHATISGSARMGGPLDWITGVHIEVSSSHGGDSCDGCGAVMNQGSTRFSWTTQDFDYNGPYDVTVVATGRRVLDVVTQTSVSTESRAAFSIEVDPAPPADPTAAPNADGTVTVSWARNSEPDLVGYQVLRRTGGASFQPVGSRVGQSDGLRVQWIDESTKTGGQFEYQVVAVRPDGDGEISDRATATSNTTVPVTTAGPGPGGPGGTGAPGSPGDPGAPVVGSDGQLVTPGSGGAFSTATPSAIDLSSLISSGAVPPGSVAVPGGVILPDGTFSPILPFGDRKASDPEDDSLEFLGQSTSRRTLLLPVATGLIMCMMALHLRRFNRRVLTPTVEP